MRLFSAVCFIFISTICLGQELNCNVQVNLSQNVQTSSVDRSVFSSLESSVREFMNNRKWTNDTYEIEERIECQLIITINEAVSVDNFKASIQVISSRPIYNSSYKSTLMNFNDKDFDIKIKYIKLFFMKSNFIIIGTKKTQTVDHSVNI